MIRDFISKKDGYEFYFYDRSSSNLVILDSNTVDTFINVIRLLGFNKRKINYEKRLMRYRGVKVSNENYSDCYADTLFMLGEKSNSHKLGSVLDSFNNTTSEDELKVYIGNKVGIINDYIRKHDELTGEISLSIENKKQEDLIYIATTLDRIIHNMGKLSTHKSSKFISVSINCSIAKKFATSRLKKDEKGLIYVMYEIPIYYRHAVIESTSALNKMLLNSGVEWFEDIHEELTLRFGILPHSLLGYIDIDEKRFVVNHWLVDQMRGEDFEIHDIISGIKIDQSDFLYYFSSSSYKTMTRFTNNNVKHINSSS